MSVKAAWIPKSERGREVARVLRDAGFDVRNKDVQGHYLCNLQCADELDTPTLRLVAYALNSERACYDEQDAFKQANDLRDNPGAAGLTEAEGEIEAKRLETAWLDKFN